MSLGVDTLKAVLADSNFSEVATMTPQATPDAAVYSCTVRVRRNQRAVLDRRPDKSVLVYTAELLVLSTVDGTYGGIVNPTVGDIWNLPLTKGGSSSVQWSAGAAQPCDGKWIIDLTHEQIVEVGGRRVGGAK